jgi:hypothetical protein
MDPRASPEQTGRNDSRVVKEQEFVTAQEIGELYEEPVFEGTRGTIQFQEPRSFSKVERTLGNLLSREPIVEFVQTHGKGQSTKQSSRGQQKQKHTVE